MIMVKNISKLNQEIQRKMQTLKQVKGHYLYNMLQDFRHLLVIDVRTPEEWDQNHIRDSFNLTDGIPKEEISNVMALAINKAGEKQSKYKELKKVRRYFLIGGTTPDQKQKMSLAIGLIPQDPDNKIYSLAEDYTEFYQRYPYVCLVKADLQKLKQSNPSEAELDRWQLYPYCRFPSQIIIDKLYLGSVFSSNSEKILQDMKIKGLIDFIHYEPPNEETTVVNTLETVPDFKKDEEKYSYLHLPFHKDVQVQINFDLINAEIDKRLNNGRVLLYCKDGETISAAFAISYLMYKAKLDVSMATLKVCQAISRSDINKWIYTQLLLYKPKK